jgi:small subunit ribosomal protein S19
MSRSSFTFVDPIVLEKIAKSENKKKPLKIWCRDSKIPKQAVGYTFLIHNGQKFFSLQITNEHIGFRFGEFAPTRKIGVHGKAGTH